MKILNENFIHPYYGRKKIMDEKQLKIEKPKKL